MDKSQIESTVTSLDGELVKNEITVYNIQYVT